MSRKVTFLFIILLLATSLAACSPAAASEKGPTRQITATGTGKVFLVPDIAYINIGVQSKAKDVSTALHDNNAQAQAISKILTSMNVDAKDIQTSSFNVSPQQKYGPNGEMLEMEYVVDNTVYVTVRDLQKLGEMLDAVVKAGANNINGIQFDVQDAARSAAIAQARKAAIEDAKKNAQEIASAAGVTLAEIDTVNIYTSGGPVPVFEGKGGVAMSAAPAPPVSAGQLVLTISADITYSIH